MILDSITEKPLRGDLNQVTNTTDTVPQSKYKHFFIFYFFSVNETGV